MQSALAFVTKLFLVVGFLLGKLVFNFFFLSPLSFINITYMVNN